MLIHFFLIQNASGGLKEEGQYETSSDHGLIDPQQTSSNIPQGNVKRCMWDAKTIVQRNPGNPSDGKWPKRGLSDGAAG